MKKTFFIISIIVAILVLFGCGTETVNTDLKQPEAETTYTYEEEVKYPRDDNGSVTIDYAKQLLKDKVSGVEIEESVDELIDYYFVNENKGIAFVDARVIGMQKMVSQVYRTVDGGETWDLLDGQLFLNSGDFNCADIGGRLIISNFASVTQSNIFVIIDVDGNIDTVLSEEVTDKFDLSGLYAEMKLSEDGERIECNWIRNYNSEDVCYTSQHDKDMKTINIEK